MQIKYFSLSFFTSLFLVFHTSGLPIAAADWNQWLGLNRDGFVKDSPALIEKLEKEMNPVWSSEPIPADFDGGYSCPVVVAGKVYVYSPLRSWKPVTSLKFNEDNARNLGVFAENVTDELIAKLDTQRTVLTDIEDMNARRKTAQEWLDTNLSADEKNIVGGIGFNRLLKGNDVLPIAAMRPAREAINKEFATDDAFSEWAKKAGLDDESIKKILTIVPRQFAVFEDTIFCLDQKDGKTLWKKSWANGWGGGWGGGSSTPLIRDGKLWFMTGAGDLHCISAADGKEIWTAKVEHPGGGNNTSNSSFLYHDGMVFILSNRLYAFDAASGKLAWEITGGKPDGKDSSPQLWQSGGKTYIIAGTQHLCCIEPKTGKILWIIPGGGYSTPAISGNRMAVVNSKKIIFYNLTAEAATQTSESEAGVSRGASLATDGKFFYAGGQKTAAAFDVATGEMKWESPNAGEEYCSPIVAAGKLLTFTQKGEINMFNAATGEALGTTDAKINRCVTPALVDGKLYIRTKEATLCLNLKK